ncbi:MAG: fatty acid desaturase family protein, partial [Bdellovibrionota bacterium]
SVLTVTAALMILGGRHLALAILMHETAHYSLFQTRWLNDLVGKWFCGAPTWQDLPRYRDHHYSHHRWAGSDQDPDQDLAIGYPVSRASLFRKFARDLFGLSGLKRLYGLVLMDLGFIGYTVSSRVVTLPKIRWRKRLALGFKNAHGMVITNLVLLGILWALHHPALYLLWVGSYLTTFSLFLRIRSIAEHGITIQDLDPFKNTRTTEANWLARVTVAPHRVNYHLEHHLLMTVPYFQLPKMHRVLRERGALGDAFAAAGYSEVIAAAQRS